MMMMMMMMCNTNTNNTIHVATPFILSTNFANQKCLFEQNDEQKVSYSILSFLLNLLY